MTVIIFLCQGVFFCSKTHFIKSLVLKLLLFYTHINGYQFRSMKIGAQWWDDLALTDNIKSLLFFTLFVVIIDLGLNALTAKKGEIPMTKQIINSLISIIRALCISAITKIAPLT